MQFGFISITKAGRKVECPPPSGPCTLMVIGCSSQPLPLFSLSLIFLEAGEGRDETAL